MVGQTTVKYLLIKGKVLADLLTHNKSRVKDKERHELILCVSSSVASFNFFSWVATTKSSSVLLKLTVAGLMKKVNTDTIIFMYCIKITFLFNYIFSLCSFAIFTGVMIRVGISVRVALPYASWVNSSLWPSRDKKDTGMKALGCTPTSGETWGSACICKFDHKHHRRTSLLPQNTRSTSNSVANESQ